MIGRFRGLVLALFLVGFLLIPGLSTICESNYCMGCDVHPGTSWAGIKVDVNSIEDNVMNFTTSYVKYVSATAYISMIYEDEDNNTWEQVVFSAPSQYPFSAPSQETFDFDTLDYNFERLIGFHTYCWEGNYGQVEQQYYDMSYFENDGNFRIAIVNDVGFATAYYPYGGWGAGINYDHVVDNIPSPAEYVYYDTYIPYADAQNYDLVIVRSGSGASDFLSIIQDDNIKMILDTEMLQTLSIVTNVVATTPASYGFVPVDSEYSLMDGLSENDTFIVNASEIFYLDDLDGITMRAFDTNTSFSANYDIEDLAFASNDTSEIVIGLVKDKNNDTYSTLFTTLGDANQWSGNYSILFYNLVSSWEAPVIQEGTVNWDTYITSLYPDTNYKDDGLLRSFITTTGDGDAIFNVDTSEAGDKSYLYTYVSGGTCDSLVLQKLTDYIDEDVTYNTDGSPSTYVDSVIPSGIGWYKFEIPLSDQDTINGNTTYKISCVDAISGLVFITSLEQPPCEDCVYNQTLFPQFYLNGVETEAPRILFEQINPSPYLGGDYPVGELTFIISGVSDNFEINKVIFRENSTGSYVNHTIHSGKGYDIGEHIFSYDLDALSDMTLSYEWFVIDQDGNYDYYSNEIDVSEPTDTTYLLGDFIRETGASGDYLTDISGREVWYWLTYSDSPVFNPLDQITGATCTGYFNGTPYAMPYYQQKQAYSSTFTGYAYDFGSIGSGYYQINATCSKTGYDTATTTTKYYTLLSEAPIVMKTQPDTTKYRTNETVMIYSLYYEKDSDNYNPDVDLTGGICNATIKGITYNMTLVPSIGQFLLEKNATDLGEMKQTYTSRCFHPTYGYKTAQNILWISDKDSSQMGSEIFYDSSTFNEDYLRFCVGYSTPSDIPFELATSIYGATCTSDYSTYAQIGLIETQASGVSNYLKYGTSSTIEDWNLDVVYCGTYLNMDLNPTDTMQITAICSHPNYDALSKVYEIGFSDAIPQLTVNLILPTEGQLVTDTDLTIRGSVSGCSTECISGCTIYLGYDGTSKFVLHKPDGTYEGVFYNVPSGNHQAYISARCSIYDEFSGFTKDSANFIYQYGTPVDKFRVSKTETASIIFNAHVNVEADEDAICTATRRDLRVYVADNGEPIVPNSRDVFDLVNELYSDTQPLLDELIFDLDTVKLLSQLTDSSIYSFTIDGFNITGTYAELLTHPIYATEWHDNFETHSWNKKLSTFRVSQGMNYQSISSDLLFKDAEGLIKNKNIDSYRPNYAVDSLVLDRSITDSDYELNNRVLKFEALVDIYCKSLTSDEYSTNTITVYSVYGSETEWNWVKNSITGLIPIELDAKLFLIILLLAPILLKLAGLLLGKVV